ncbi:uncharacterized protein [Panulirus ornatus]|uniref:uncharacterized protein isoform X2 n=2 Tax=Panulirus ornatus TaxID=150431 RepID=UPI003A86172F
MFEEKTDTPQLYHGSAVNQATMHRQIQCLGILYLMFLVAGDDIYAQDEDDINYYLNQLYKETKDNLDPHDMLANLHEKKDLAEGTKGGTSQSTGPSTNDKGCDNYEHDDLIRTHEQLNKCQEQIEKLEHSIEVEQQKSSVLQKKIMDDGFIDMQAFYSRSIHHIWNVLQLQEAEHILKDGNYAMLRYLVVRVTKDDVDLLQQYLKHEKHVHEVDEFLHRAFKLDDRPQGNESNFFDYIMSLVAPMKSAFDFLKNVEIWLHILCLVFLFLALWAAYLFVRDIQQELKWGRVLGMMMVNVFFICCLWHWRHMHKVAESRRHAKMVKRGFNDIPEECKPGSRGTAGSIWDWMKTSLLGAPDVCERYFEDLMVNPAEEITPTMVISETLAKFCLQPLQHIGSESAKFITNFYSNVPVMYHFPATIIFVVLLVIILFYIFGYGIDFPLWMGGIRPVYRSESVNTSEVDRITKEAVAQLNRDREKFMKESRSMLTDITRAAISTQNQENIQPLIVMSSSILENSLEHLISKKLTEVLHPEGFTEDTAICFPPRLQRKTQNDSGVFTVTSTPLTGHFTSEDQTEGQTSLDVVTRGGNNEVKGLTVSTDSTHPRLKGSCRKKILPPKNGSTSNRSDPSENSNTASCSTLGDKQLEQKSSSSISINTDRSTSLSSSQNESGNQCQKQEDYVDVHQNRPSSGASDDLTPVDVIDADITSTAMDFYSEVKNILEESLNSSLDDSNVVPDTNAPNSIRRRHNKSQNNDPQGNQVEHFEEVELSSSGVKFLKTVENILTP